MKYGNTGIFLLHVPIASEYITVTVSYCRYFADIFLIIAFVCNAWQEIILIAMLTGILLILFGSLIYFAEYNPKTNNDNWSHPPVYSIMQVFS